MVYYFYISNNIKWYGIANKGLMKTSHVLPITTYLYVLYLNDTTISSEPITGWVNLNL